MARLDRHGSSSHLRAYYEDNVNRCCDHPDETILAFGCCRSVGETRPVSAGRDPAARAAETGVEDIESTRASGGPRRAQAVHLGCRTENRSRHVTLGCVRGAAAAEQDLLRGRALGRLRLRVHQRLSRHGQRGHDGHLHPHAQADAGRPLLGRLNFLGVLLGGTAVAFSIVNLLPVDLLIDSASVRAIVMVVSLLLAGVIWNLATWWYGLPVSSSHTLIGSILGVGLANSLITRGDVSGVNWTKAGEVGLSLLISPVIGFVAAAGLLAGDEAADPRAEALSPAGRGGQSAALDARGAAGDVRRRQLRARLQRRPEGDGADPAGADRLPADVLRARPQPPVAGARSVREAAIAIRDILEEQEPGSTDPGHPVRSRRDHRRTWRESRASPRSRPPTAGRSASRSIASAGTSAGPGCLAGGPRGDRAARQARSTEAIEYVPFWVIFGVALALGIGTTIGYKRIVVTVAEKIGKTHLTYAQGAAAELVAAATIGLADVVHMPVSTTHVLSSGVAGTMWANRSGIQGETVRKIGLAWVLTLPAAILLSAALFTRRRLPDPRRTSPDCRHGWPTARRRAEAPGRSAPHGTRPGRPPTGTALTPTALDPAPAGGDRRW